MCRNPKDRPRKERITWIIVVAKQANSLLYQSRRLTCFFASGKMTSLHDGFRRTLWADGRQGAGLHGHFPLSERVEVETKLWSKGKGIQSLFEQVKQMKTRRGGGSDCKTGGRFKAMCSAPTRH